MTDCDQGTLSKFKNLCAGEMSKYENLINETGAMSAYAGAKEFHIHQKKNFETAFFRAMGLGIHIKICPGKIGGLNTEYKNNLITIWYNEGILLTYFIYHELSHYLVSNSRYLLNFGLYDEDNILHREEEIRVELLTNLSMAFDQIVSKEWRKYTNDKEIIRNLGWLIENKLITADLTPTWNKNAISTDPFIIRVLKKMQHTWRCLKKMRSPYTIIKQKIWPYGKLTRIFKQYEQAS